MSLKHKNAFCINKTNGLPNPIVRGHSFRTTDDRDKDGMEHINSIKKDNAAGTNTPPIPAPLLHPPKVPYSPLTQKPFRNWSPPNIHYIRMEEDSLWKTEAFFVVVLLPIFCQFMRLISMTGPLFIRCYFGQLCLAPPPFYFFHTYRPPEFSFYPRERSGTTIPDSGSIFHLNGNVKIEVWGVLYLYIFLFSRFLNPPVMLRWGLAGITEWAHHARAYTCHFWRGPRFIYFT